MSYIDEKYFLSMLDDYSRFTWLFPLKTKDQTFLTFFYFIAMIEEKFSKKILALQIDGGASSNH